MNQEYIDTADPGEKFVAPFRCPFSGHISNGVIKFVVLQPCGHVVSQRALQEMSEAQTMSIPLTQPSSSSASPSTDPSTSPHAQLDLQSVSHAYRQCIICQKSYLPNKDVIELASDPSTQSTSGPDLAQKEKKRSHDLQTVEPHSISPVPDRTPSSKRPKLS